MLSFSSSSAKLVLVIINLMMMMSKTINLMTIIVKINLIIRTWSNFPTVKNINFYLNLRLRCFDHYYYYWDSDVLIIIIIIESHMFWLLLSLLLKVRCFDYYCYYWDSDILIIIIIIETQVFWLLGNLTSRQTVVSLAQADSPGHQCAFNQARLK